MRQQLAVQSSAMEAVSLILAEKETAITLMVITLWSLWTKRNAIRDCQPQRLPSPQRPVMRARRNRPPEGFLKLNCDTSFLKESMSGSWGFLIRDHDGYVVITG
ncbi:hypothetical protein BDA96_04G278000 [Sorghum bicolor]|uniref:RNase H type-1 domain-containing protein n=1 Tax=Sorghum bicolor TaxID=4558 RepID=A0A921R6X0_SORBI|nr:hypothetical protein BDA96_04G278000 [Sorghum bicolor]